MDDFFAAAGGSEAVGCPRRVAGRETCPGRDNAMNARGASKHGPTGIFAPGGKFIGIAIRRNGGPGRGMRETSRAPDNGPRSLSTCQTRTRVRYDPYRCMTALAPCSTAALA
jgi:hypothetical protein